MESACPNTFHILPINIYIKKLFLMTLYICVICVNFSVDSPVAGFRLKCRIEFGMQTALHCRPSRI